MVMVSEFNAFGLALFSYSIEIVAVLLQNVQLFESIFPHKGLNNVFNTGG